MKERRGGKKEEGMEGEMREMEREERKKGENERGGEEKERAKGGTEVRDGTRIIPTVTSSCPGRRPP